MSKTERKISFCIPGPLDLQAQYLEGVDRLGIPTDSLTLQIGIPHSYIPGEMVMNEYAEQVQRSVDVAVSDCPFEGRVRRAFLNLEGVRGDGTWWLGDKMREGYNQDDINAIELGTMRIQNRLSYLGIRQAATSAYRIPALPHNRSYNFTDFSRLLTSIPAIEKLDWLWHNLYPAGGDIANRTITEENKHLHTERIKQGAEILETLAQGRPVVACLFPRYSTDNLTYLNHYMPTLLETNISELLIWSNPHTEFMTGIYLRELEECADSIKKWLATPIEDSPIRGAAS